MTINIGNVPASALVQIPWNTYAADGSSITRSSNGAIRIYKNGSSTERSSSSGIVDNKDFDSVTGFHLCTIDLSDNTDAGFYAAGSNYSVVCVGTVVDSKTVNPVIGTFSIENRVATADVTKWNGTAVSSPATAGIPDVNVKNMNNVAATSITAVNANQGTTQPVNFTGTGASALAKADVVDIAGTASAGTAGYVGLDWAHITAPTTTVDLSGTTIKNVDNAIANVTTVASVVATVTANMTQINGSANAAAQLARSAATIINGTATAGTLTTTQMTTDLTEPNADQYVGRILIFTSGAMIAQATDITAYNPTGGLLTFTAVTDVPLAGDTWIIV